MTRKIWMFGLMVAFMGHYALSQEKLLERGNNRYNSYSFSPAIDIYKRVLDKGYVSQDLLERLGNSYYFNSKYEDAAKIYGQLVEAYPEDIAPEIYFRYAQSLKSMSEYEKADSMMAKFHNLANVDSDLVKTEEEYMAEIEANSGRYTIAPFQFNSTYADFAPTFYKKGLIFSSDRDTGNFARYRHTWNSNDFLDLYKVNADSASQGYPAKLDEAINSRFHESTTAMTQDGNTLYFTRNNIEKGKIVRDQEGLNRLKIYRAVKENGVWAYIEELPFNNDSYSVANPALSPDEKTLYFASDMPGTLGSSDLFKVSINSDGTFGTPINLGNNINTPFRETFPYVTGDDILYFASDGHPGLGGLDVFATNIKRDHYDNSVLNVGRPINGPKDDFSFIIDASQKGYFASNRDGGMGSDDIYSFVENRPLNFDCSQLVTGTVRDKISNDPLVGATVKVINEDNEEVSYAITDSKGNYKVTIDCNKGNFVRATIEGYVPAEEYLEPNDGKDRIVDFYLERETVTAGFGDDLAKLLQLSTIYFDLNKFTIRKDAEIEIQKVIAAMEKYPSLKIKVNSHTDSRGNDAYNMWLSQKRAAATVSYMISKGISADRLQSEGFGETKLVNGCSNGVSCTEEQHQLNRRSEFIILE